MKSSSINQTDQILLISGVDQSLKNNIKILKQSIETDQESAMELLKIMGVGNNLDLTV